MSKTQTVATINPHGNAARELDKFYTSPAAVKACLDSLRRFLGPEGLLQHDLWIEPSAGAGAFLCQLPPNRLGIDLAPEHPEVQRGDFLAWQPDRPVKSPIVIGNPPFGKNARLAVRFFNHAASFASRIAFIVPRTFEKESLQARLDRAFHLETHVALPEKSFLFEGRTYQVPAVWQVWTRRDTPRVINRGSLTCKDFEFCEPDEADFAIQRIGANAGRIKLDPQTRSPSSHVFVRATASRAEALLAAFHRIDFDEVRNSTAGNPSISKREIVALYEKLTEQTRLAA